MQCACALLYCHPWNVRLYYIYQHCLIKGTIFGGGGCYWTQKCGFWFCLEILYGNIYSKKNRTRYSHNCMLVLCKVLAIIYCRILLKKNSLDRFFENSSNTNFQENPSVGSRFVLCGRTYRQTDMTKLKVALRSFAYASKIQSQIQSNIFSFTVILTL